MLDFNINLAQKFAKEIQVNDNQNLMTIHIGLPKTGSTSMQEGFWSRIPELDYVGPNIFGNSDEIMINNIMSLEELEFQNRQYDFQTRISKRFSGSKPTLISNERLTQGAVSFPSIILCGDRLCVARRLNTLFPDAQILIILRNQPSFILSMFGERLKGPHISKHSFSQWFELQKTNREKGLGSFFDTGDFHLLINAYQNIFGPKKVKVAMFEEFVSNPEKFFNETTEFMGLSWKRYRPYWEPTHSNSRSSQLELALLNGMWKYPVSRKLVPQKVRCILREQSRKLFQLNTKYTAGQLEYLNDLYSEGNHILQRITLLPLEKFGYPL